ncbi:MAG: host-nuclease inhibitor Gam family protein [Alphaproteobacteria bacterium]|nr:host-nuclease inhibitor Gam family protein [Alphaproteobacteria bacterium]
MTYKLKSLSPPTEPPQSRDEADKMIERYGAVQREITRQTTVLEDAIASLRKQADTDMAAYKAEAEGIHQAVHTFASANRRMLTEGNKVKHHIFSTGEVKWRDLPPKVSIKGTENVINVCFAQGLDRFVNRKETINKEAMLAEPSVARTIPGVTVGSAGEQFTINPFEEKTNG